MQRSSARLAATFLVALASAANAQTAGSTLLGVSVTELREVAQGWSVKQSILDRDVYNDQDEKVGTIDDIVIGPDKEVSYAIVNAAGFLDLTKHDVAVPVTRMELVNGRLVLPGATREALQEAPTFQYAN